VNDGIRTRAKRFHDGLQIHHFERSPAHPVQTATPIVRDSLHLAGITNGTDNLVPAGEQLRTKPPSDETSGTRDQDSQVSAPP
jgi:hypothetical protein